ncbi:PREDICTED: E3 ubiquitin-protein ligase RING1-like [Camelina sativa]|uniref:RING-type E3 ubiquitin transferase n=1 Tax=Camelina sativa TaxID=90675 RepID=A0ABM0YGD2_CAMSA|nr:PREDICTED: E3 ubiquitin-protein ligase RING1-like [Camelina sativa]XP_010500500.1 PREDICTED: E3 ubiquitin-protein ligase RING1-like [Camelina sativa]
MEDATETTTYWWCHVCSRSVNPVIEGEIITCNFCQSGFVEEMDDNNHLQDSADDDDDHHHTADSLWAPILMGMMNSHHDQQHQEDSESVVEDEDDDNDDDDVENNDGEEVDINRQLEAIRRIRSRHSAAISNLLQGIRAGLLVESETNPDNSELVTLINSFNQTISVHEDSIDTITYVASGPLGDYLIGPGFEAWLQRLAQNDLNNRYGTPPATKEAVEALGVVKIEDGLLQCTVCLDDFEIGMDAKEMPCKHKFHSDCLLPWLELHSSCPVCRYLLPTGDDDGEPKTDGEALRNNEEDISIDSVVVGNGSSSPDSSSNNSSA